MRPKGRKWLAVALVGTSAAFAIIVVFLQVAGNNCVLRLQQLERVTPGMTRAEVEALLGGPPGDYRTDVERFSFSHLSLYMLWSEDWIADEGKVSVWFDAAGCVVQRRVSKPIDLRPPPLKQLVVWLQDASARIRSKW
jgi:hypothetical protein